MSDAPPLPSSIDGHHHRHLVVELALLRVPSPASLVRAAAVCKLWRRVVADAGFLRLHRSLHTPAAVAGYFFHILRFDPLRQITSFFPSFLPSSPPGDNDDIVDARHFSLDFLPGYIDGDWKVLDSRGSLLLMVKDARRRGPTDFPVMLVVCEPLARRYTIIPPPPAPAPDLLRAGCQQLHGFYLVDGGGANAAADDEVGGRIGMSNFRVQCEVRRGGVTHAAVFAAAGGDGGGAGSWSEKAIGSIIGEGIHHTRLFGRAGGAWYSLLSGGRTAFAVDGHTGEYSPFVLPAATTTEELPAGSLWNKPVHITDGRDGKPRIFSAAGNTMKVFATVSGGEWALEKKAVLEEATRGLPGYKPSFFSKPLLIWAWGGPGFVTLIAWGNKEPWLFSVDLETMQVKPATADVQGMMYKSELPWPPVLHACLDSEM
ncbi:unnamed protein product [Urochloa humidicola]